MLFKWMKAVLYSFILSFLLYLLNLAQGWIRRRGREELLASTSPEKEEQEELSESPPEESATEIHVSTGERYEELTGALGDWGLYYAASDVGRVREENQDRYFVSLFKREDTYAIGVCDGMGGHNGGSEAAETAASFFASSLKGVFGLSAKECFEFLKKAMYRADQALRVKENQNPQELKGMGTTAVVGIAKKETFTHVYTGDSRAYIFRNGSLLYRSKDHNKARYLVEEGAISEEESRRSHFTSSLTSCLGALENESRIVLEPEWDSDSMKNQACIKMEPGDLVLLCTDGFYEPFGSKLEEDMAYEFESSQEGMQNLLWAKMKDMVRFAVESDGSDNATIALVYWKK